MGLLVIYIISHKRVLQLTQELLSVIIIQIKQNYLRQRESMNKCEMKRIWTDTQVKNYHQSLSTVRVITVCNVVYFMPITKTF